MQKIALFLLVSLASTPVWCQLSTLDEESLRLDTHLTNIRDDARAQRYFGGLMELGLGAGIGTIGYYSLQQIPSDMPEVRQGVLVSFGVAAGAFAVPGLLILALKSDYERLPDEYFSMITLTASDAQKRRIKGELALQTLSEKAFGERMTSAGLWLALGLSQFNTGVSSSAGSFSTGFVFLTAGITSLIFPKKAETEYAAFHAWQQKSPVVAEAQEWSWTTSLSPAGEPQFIVRASY